MIKFITLGLFSSALLLGGCASKYADVPAPARFENAEQQKLQAANHWKLIARHIAKQIADDTADRLNGRLIYVPTPNNEQAFVTGFRELLITELVRQGTPVSIKPEQALQVDVQYSIFKFSEERARQTYHYGDATALAAGLWAVGGVMAGNLASAKGVDAGIKLLTGAAALDGFGWLSNEALGRGRFANGAVPRSEILLTTSIADGNRLISRVSNIYYTADEDHALYWNKQNTNAGTTLKVMQAEGK